MTVRLNGWQRLWVCLAVLWTVPVVVGSFFWWESWYSIRADAFTRLDQSKTILAAHIRAKYPGAYDDLSDRDIERRALEKHPGEYTHFRRTPGHVSVSIPGVGVVHVPVNMTTSEIEKASSKINDDGERAILTARSGLSRDEFQKYLFAKVGVREFQVKDNESQQDVTFVWFGAADPNDDDLEEIFRPRRDSHASIPSPENLRTALVGPAAVNLGVWLLPPLALYLCGLAVHWVRQGFAQRAEGGSR